jgi:hypothetical protein
MKTSGFVCFVIFALGLFRKLVRTFRLRNDNDPPDGAYRRSASIAVAKTDG